MNKILASIIIFLNKIKNNFSLIKGTGFVSSTDSLEAIKNKITSKTGYNPGTFVEGFSTKKNKNISGSGVLYVRSGIGSKQYCLFYSTGFTTNASGYLTSIDGRTYVAVTEEVVVGYSKV